jgi:signal transduction histidine kinase
MGAELIAALGLVFVVAGIFIWFTFVLPTTTSTQGALHELVMHVLFGGLILALGLHTERSDLGAHERFDVMVWCFSGFVFLLGLAVWGAVDQLLAGNFSGEIASDILVFGSLGGAFGVIAGINAGRSTRNRELAERIDEQRETLVLLTRLLRHDIRNSMMAIQGHAEIASEYVEPDGESSMEVIQTRVDAILRLLADANTLVEALGGDREFERVNLTAVLRSEVESIRDSHSAVDVAADVPEDLVVTADGLVHQVFSNLLENAVAHNDPEGLELRVEATDDGDHVEVVVADNGSGIPEDLRAECFELGRQGPGSDGDGLGLYLVSRLADVYGGDVTLAENTDGATFHVTLPK